MQPDLFRDSRDARLRNGAIDALRRRDGGALRQAIDGRRAEFPGDQGLASDWLA
jgi:hypothetical protein